MYYYISITSHADSNTHRISSEVLKVDAHKKRGCMNLSIINNYYEYLDEVFFISVSLQTISGQYSNIRLDPKEGRIVIYRDGITL